MNLRSAAMPPQPYTTFGASGYALDALQLFHGASSAGMSNVLAPLVADCPVLRLPQGAHLADADGACLYVVLRGGLEAVSAQQRGGSAGNGNRVLPGECVGELSVLDKEADVEVLVALQETDVLAIEAPRVWQLIDASSDVARNLLRLLAFRVRAANAQLRRRQKVGEFYRQLSLADGLTSLQNRAWLDEHLPLMVAQAHASQLPLSVIMIDLDHFKRFNDEHGHVAGDKALQTAARTVAAALRPSDHAVRYGGEEMLVLLPHTGLPAALVVARRLRDHLRQATVFEDGRALPHITASLGVASLEPDQAAQDLIATADAALYRAKAAGRDTVA